MGIGWKESLAIGVEEIDNQHRELVRQFSCLLSACEDGKGEQEAREVLEFLEGYVRRHFSDEEALQRLHRYPAYHEHCSEHLSFMTRMEALRRQVDGEGVELRHLVEINNLLYAWLVRHISRSDRALGLFLEKSEPIVP